MTAEHIPTEATRRLVQGLAQFGVPQPQIAAKIGVSEKTLRKHYAAELNDGATAANLAVARRLYEVATKGAGKEAVTAMIFWLKTRAGWRETINVNDVTDPHAGARERLAQKLGEKLPSIGEESGASLVDPIGRA